MPSREVEQMRRRKHAEQFPGELLWQFGVLSIQLVEDGIGNHLLPVEDQPKRAAGGIRFNRLASQDHSFDFAFASRSENRCLRVFLMYGQLKRQLLDLADARGK